LETINFSHQPLSFSLGTGWPLNEYSLYRSFTDIEKESLPKISVITPSYNNVQYIEQTIISVISQGYPNLEYIIIDGGSTDGSLDIIKKYAQWLSYWVSEPDKGMYDAINKGFAHSTGVILSWLNSDDVYLPWTFQIVAQIFLDLPNIEWLTSRTPLSLHQNCIPSIIPHHTPGFARTWFYRGCNLGNRNEFVNWIQQESTFWRRSLWEKSGRRVDDGLIMAGDFELWSRFWNYADLVSTQCPLGCFRSHSNQKTKQDMATYYSEAELILKKNKNKTINHRLLLWLARKLFQLSGRGGERLGSKLSFALFDDAINKWTYAYRHTI